ncbi:MAG: YqzL family protein [Candidatus Poribacteria bacterium]
MDSVIYWGVFENTGSIEAYLTYKTMVSSPKKDDESIDDTVNSDYESVDINSFESVSLTE